MIDPPSGDLSQYLRSLERMRRLDPRAIYPGHGPVVERAVEKIEEYIAHRSEREEQVIRGLSAGARTPEDLVPKIHQGYPEELYPAACRSVLAHLLKLERDGRVVRTGHGDRFSLAEPSGLTT